MCWPVTRGRISTRSASWPPSRQRPAPPVRTGKLGARLSVQLSAIRRVLGGGVTADRRSVALNLKEVSTDLETLLDSANDEHTVVVYTGEFLPEEVDDDWAIGARNQARATFAAAARRQAAIATGDGNHDKAAALARRLIEVDRYDETAYQLLVDSLRAAGGTATARHAHQEWVRNLSEIDITDPPFEG